MTAVLFRHFQALRANFHHIGAAVNASREFTRSGAERSETATVAKSGIPL